MRVIAGRFGGRTLTAPPGLATRPLTDRIKQSLFDWLGQDLTGERIADVCAGSGGFGIEACSRGAAEIHLIEPDAMAVRTIRANLHSLGDPPEIVVHAVRFQAALPRLRGLTTIFADPPFPWYGEQPALLTELLTLATAALADDGRLLIRGEQGQALPPLPSGLVLAERRAYGRSWIARLRL